MIGPTLRSLLRVIVINAAIGLVLIASLEVTARVFNVIQGKTFFRPPLDSPLIMIGDNPRPSLLPDGSGLFYHDERPVPRQKPPGEFRIIAVGGSTTVGKFAFETGGVHYPMVLERALNGAPGTVHFRVLNAGGVGYSTLHDLINIESRVLEFEPDLIILMESINDYTVAYYGATAQPDYSNKYLHPYNVAPEYQATSSLFGLLAQSRLLYRYEIPHKILPSLRREIRSDHDVRQAGRYYLRNLASIKAITDEHHVPLMILSQPHRLKASAKVNADAVYFNEILTQFTRERKIPFVDLFNEFGRDEKYFVDEVHHTPEGVRRLVQVLRPQLLKVVEQGAANVLAQRGHSANRQHAPAPRMSGS